MPKVLVRLQNTPTCDEDCGDGFREILLIDQKEWNATLDALKENSEKTGRDSFEMDHSNGGHGCILIYADSLFDNADVQRITPKEITLLRKFVALDDKDTCQWYRELIQQISVRKGPNCSRRRAGPVD